jgi:hypothetical protein
MSPELPQETPRGEGDRVGKGVIVGHGCSHPRAFSVPAGTAWQCDCGKVWVVREQFSWKLRQNVRWWEPEGWWARRRRTRRQRRVADALTREAEDVGEYGRQLATPLREDEIDWLDSDGGVDRG